MIVTVKRRFQATLVRHMRPLVGPDAEVAEEIRNLLGILSRIGARSCAIPHTSCQGVMPFLGDWRNPFGRTGKDERPSASSHMPEWHLGISSATAI
jgi:hypothetical protein